jgi:Txe/YoeB family toxin of Txe-Axe toxin-antitoxin module
MYSLIYISSAVEKFKKQDLQDLLDVSRKNNLEHEITGLLIIKDYIIVQYIEGEKDKILQLIENIKKDVRHFNLTIIKEEPIEKRLFEQWSMGIKNFDELEGKDLDVIKNFDFESLDNIPQIFKSFLVN